MELHQLCTFCGEIGLITFMLSSRPDLKKKYLSLSRRNTLVHLMDFRICLNCSISLEKRYDFVDYATTLQMKLLKSGLDEVVSNPQQSKTGNEIISVCDSPSVSQNKNDSKTIVVLDSDDELELIEESPDANLLSEGPRKRHKFQDSFVKVVEVIPIPSLHKGFSQMNAESANLQKKDVTPKKQLEALQRNRPVELKTTNRMATTNSLNLNYWCKNCNFCTNAIAQFLKHVTNYQCTFLYCSQCKAEFQGLKGLLEHCLYHVRGEIYRCHLCQFETTNQRLYVTHMRHNCGEIHCDYCEGPQKRVHP